MKYLLSLFVILLSGFIFHSVQSQNRVKIGFAELKGYTVKAGFEPKSGYNTQLYGRKEQFFQHYKTAGTAGVKPGKVDFNRFVVLVCQSAPTKNETTLKLERLVKVQGVLEVYFTAVTGKPRTTSYTPACMYTTALDRSLMGMVFYVNGKIVQDLRN
jgi:hypothetical protein